MKKSDKKRKFHPSMRSILFVSLALFGFSVILMIWIVLYQLLNNFYYNAKVSEFEKSIEVIEANLETDSLEQMCYSMSLNSKICIRVYKVDSTVTEIVSSDILADCFIHHIPAEEWETYYLNALQNDGIDIAQRSIHDLLSGGNSSSSQNKTLNLIYSKIVVTPSGTTHFIMLDTVFTPVKSLGTVITNQLIIISIFMLILTFIFALYLSKMLSSPLIRMNNAAKQLALGNYDIEFNGNGYLETHELSESLNYASRELSKNDALQKELIANVSHDLRTPLTLIRGYAEVMHDIPGENTPENVQIIIDETTHLSELVSDMLDLSRIRSGAIAPNPEVFNLTETVSETITRYKKFTDKNGFAIYFNFSENVFINADKRMILQVIYNFINNAINYSNDIKEITVSQECDGQNVILSVSDRGEGIEEDKLQYIWDRYYKLDKDHKIPAVGSGLGLSIAKQILKSHSATFGVQSKLGSGSTFWFKLHTVRILPISVEQAPNM